MFFFSIKHYRFKPLPSCNIHFIFVISIFFYSMQGTKSVVHDKIAKIWLLGMSSMTKIDSTWYCRISHYRIQLKPSCNYHFWSLISLFLPLLGISHTIRIQHDQIKSRWYCWTKNYSIKPIQSFNHLFWSLISPFLPFSRGELVVFWKKLPEFDS